MFHSEQHCERERARLERIIDRLLNIIDEQLVVIDDLVKNKAAIAVSAKENLVPKSIPVGGTSQAVFTEFDGPNGTGNVVPASGPITYDSDNKAVATVDANGLATGLSAGVANITGVDPASPNKVAAGDVLTVTAVAAAAVSATLALQ